jgi:hypothetical protein
MAKNKRPRHVSAKDWYAVDSPALSDDILAAMRPARETFPELAEASAKRKAVSVAHRRNRARC